MPFCYAAARNGSIEELDGTFKSGFRNATRWKDGRLFGELVEQKVELVKSLLAKAREIHHHDQPLDGATARRALEGAGSTLSVLALPRRCQTIRAYRTEHFSATGKSSSPC